MKLLPILALTVPLAGSAQDAFDGLAGNMSNLYRLSNAKSFSISPENFTGEKGKGGMATEGVASAQARELGRGWKVNTWTVNDADRAKALVDMGVDGIISDLPNVLLASVGRTAIPAEGV